MSGNSFGTAFKITTFGESHGLAIGVVIDGCPAGLILDMDFIQNELDKRKPGQSNITTQRKESDTFEILSGVANNTTLGSPIALIIRNENQKSADYSHLTTAYRPSHADYTYEQKYGVRDANGGGRSSARETVARVAAGAIAKLLLQKVGIKINAWVHAVKDISMADDYSNIDFDNIEHNIVRCPDTKIAEEMITLIEKTKKNGDTVGGIIRCVISGCPVGLGAPVFDKLNAELAKAMMSINAAKGFELGSGFAGTQLFGSEHNDIFENVNDKIRTQTNNSGGIQGGISNGMDIHFKVAFKPVSTIMQSQQSIDNEGNTIMLEGKGRHDPCVLPRAVPIVEAMAALVIVDFYLRSKLDKINDI
jgi:chorismate synthase